MLSNRVPAGVVRLSAYLNLSFFLFFICIVASKIGNNIHSFSYF